VPAFIGPLSWAGMGYEAIDASGGAQLKVMAPLAPAFELSIPERPADTGLFGPESIVWRVHHDRSFPLAGMRGYRSGGETA